MKMLAAFRNQFLRHN